MNAKCLLTASLIFLIAATKIQAQASSDTTNKTVGKKYQAKAPPTQPFGKEAFKASNKNNSHLDWEMTELLVNSRGTTFMIDPLLEGYDMPLLMNFPITQKGVPHVDAIFATHSDNDHYSVATFKDLSSVTKEYHSTIYVDSLMKNDGLHSFGHGISDTFRLRPCTS